MNYNYFSINNNYFKVNKFEFLLVIGNVINPQKNTFSYFLLFQKLHLLLFHRKSKMLTENCIYVLQGKKSYLR